MITKNLSLDTKLDVDLGFRISNEVEIGEILLLLQREFPNGFYGQEATSFLKSEMGEMPSGFKNDPLYKPAGTFYKSLVEVGYLEVIDEKSKRKGYLRYDNKKRIYNAVNQVYQFYRVKPDVLSGYKPPLPKFVHDLPLSSNMQILLENYMTLTGTTRIGVERILVESLENLVLGDEKFLGTMELLKRENPQAYASGGGRYLDRLMQTTKR